MRWLLERFGVQDALIGDLEEEKGAGRSGLWLARQTSVAILVQVARDLWTTKLLTLGTLMAAYAAGLATSAVGSILIMKVIVPAAVSRALDLELINIPIRLFHFVIGFAMGWAIARLHRAHVAIVLLLAAYSGVSYGISWMRHGPSETIRVSSIATFGLLAGGLPRWRRSLP